MTFKPAPAPRAGVALLEELGLWALGPGDGGLKGWRAEAACRNLPTDLFFPVGKGPRAQSQARLAKQVCSECPVVSQCLDYALAANARYGVFGGMEEDDRRRLRRRLYAGAVPLQDGDLDEAGDLDGVDEELEESA